MLNVYMMPAGVGDFFIIEYGTSLKRYYIFIDGGDAAGTLVYKRALSILKQKGNTIDAMIFTHIDDDHISGALKALAATKELPHIEKIYINMGSLVEQRLKIEVDNEKPEKAKKEYLHEAHTYHSVSKALSIEALLKEKGLSEQIQPCVMMRDFIMIGNAGLRIISPGRKQLERYLREWNKQIKKMNDKKQNIHAGKMQEDKKLLSEYLSEEITEDSNPINGSSIAFIFEYENCKLAFLGDAHPSVCVEGVYACYEKNIEVDLVKVPHHGSCHNFSEELYDVLKSNCFLVSANGKSNKPHPAFLGKLLEQRPEARIFCNYDWMKSYKFTKEDRKQYLTGEEPQISYLQKEQNIQNGIKIRKKIEDIEGKET